MLEAIRVTHVVASLSREAGGPSYSVPALASAETKLGAHALLRCTDAGRPSEHAAGAAQLQVHSLRAGIFGRLLRASPDLAKALNKDARSGAVLHAHGLWLAPNIYPARAKSRAHGAARLIHSPRGMLGAAALAISSRKKKAFWLAAQRAALGAADCLHATAASEFEDIRRAGLKNPVAVIPNGIDLPDLAGAPRPMVRGNLVLSLGRVHPKKGLDRLVRAWAEIEREFPDWKLRIVGPAELRHDEELRALARSLGLERATIEGPVYDAEKLALLRQADLFVLPTLNENFAISVAEALAAETPVISTKGAPWAGLETEHCGWWIDHGVEPLTQAIRQALTLSHEERMRMGARGRAWMARDFGWDRIAADMLDVYQWLRVGGDAPSTVRLD